MFADGFILEDAEMFPSSLLNKLNLSLDFNLTGVDGALQGLEFGFESKCPVLFNELLSASLPKLLTDESFSFGDKTVMISGSDRAGV